MSSNDSLSGDEGTAAEPEPTTITSDFPWEKYRLRVQSPDLRAEGLAPDSVPYLSSGVGASGLGSPGSATSRLSGTTGAPGAPDTSGAQTQGKRKWFSQTFGLLTRGEISLVAISVVALVAAALGLLDMQDPKAVGIFALIALAPLTVVVILLFWADRYAPIRARYLVLAGLWGAGVATLIAGLINSGLFQDFIAIIGDVSRAEILSAVAVAPVSEEVMKGAGAILVLIFARKYVVSPTNGLVVGAVVGAGFAYVENVQYFIQAHAQGSAILGMTIVGRAVLSPFVHPMATSFTGLFFGLAILKKPSWWGWVWRIAVGLIVAMAVHALWNTLASAEALWIVLYLVIELPLFVLWMVLVLRRARRQAETIRNGLSPYVATGWLEPAEVQMVCDRKSRRYARRWARRVGREARKAVSQYLVAAGRLGSDQVNMERTGPDQDRVALARQSLTTMLASRARYLELGALYDATQSTRERRGFRRKRSRAKEGVA